MGSNFAFSQDWNAFFMAFMKVNELKPIFGNFNNISLESLDFYRI